MQQLLQSNGQSVASQPKRTYDHLRQWNAVQGEVVACNAVLVPLFECDGSAELPGFAVYLGNCNVTDWRNNRHLCMKLYRS
jgi:hypothetical protein